MNTRTHSLAGWIVVLGVGLASCDGAMSTPLPDGSVPRDGAPPAACGGARPPTSGVGPGSDGLVISRDGTIYYTQPGSVGRLTPTGERTNRWATRPTPVSILGLALDVSNEYLYVGLSGSIARLHISTRTFEEEYVSDIVPGAMTLGPDGALYFCNDVSVGRVSLGEAIGTLSRASSERIEQCGGLAFLADGTLLVGSTGGMLVRLTMTDGAETARAVFATGLGRIHAVAVDAEGRVYVTSENRLVRMEADGTGAADLLTTIASPADMAFGAGALDCEDLYVAAGGGLIRYEMGTTAGPAVPWQ